MKNNLLILRMAGNDFKSRYAASVLGVMWAFVMPIITIIVFWVVFQLGFKSVPIENVPYILWFAVAYVPWIYFNDMLNFGVTALVDYSYLVKKVKFRVGYIPLIRMVSSLFVHLFFVVFLCFMFGCYKMPVTLFSIQALYYSFALTCFSLGLVFLLSALAVFFRDIAQFVIVILQIGFWITPIFWNIDQMDGRILNLVKINPLYYIIEGYRDSFLYAVPFWKHPVLSCYFWIVTLLVCVLGYFTFKRLRPHFADEL